MSNLGAVVSAIYPKKCIVSLRLGINLSEIGDMVTYQLPLLDKMSLVDWVHHSFRFRSKVFLTGIHGLPFLYIEFNLRIPC